MISIVLDPDRVAYGLRLAARRNGHAYSTGALDKNGLVTDYNGALKLHELGVLAEYAAACALDCLDTWNYFHEKVRSDIPDMAGFIDAKGIKKSNHRLVVKKNEGHNDWAYLLVSAEHHPRYDLLCWCWGHEAMTEKYWRDPVGGRAAYFVDAGAPFMKESEELRRIVRQKKAEAA